MQLFYSLTCCFIMFLSITLKGNQYSHTDYYQNFKKYYEKGDFYKAEEFLLKILKDVDSLPNNYKIAIYNNLGVLNNKLGKYNEALNYYNYAENLAYKEKSYEELGDIFLNKSRIFNIINEYDKSIEYLNQSLKLYQTRVISNTSRQVKISSNYLNLGLTYYNKKQYKKALSFLEKSKIIKEKYNLPEKSLAYLNIAKVLVETKDYINAEKNFLLSIHYFNKEFGSDYYRLTSVLFDYGLFLRSQGRNQEALNAHQKALDICLKNYGNKHSFISLAYKHIGNHYLNEKNYTKALNYYQKSLIAIVKDFNDTNVDSNPSINSAIFNYGLLEALKCKANALKLLSFQQSDNKQLHTLGKSYETINLALGLIEKIRTDYASDETKLYLAENEKDTYLLAIEITKELYSITKKTEFIAQMFHISNLSKSRLLRDEILENEILYNKNSSDSILNKRNSIKTQISSYNKLIQDEYLKTKPDSLKVELWKDKLFELNRSNDSINESIKTASSYYKDLAAITEPLNLKELQHKLKNSETIIEYFITHNNKNGLRNLYIFTVSMNKIDFSYQNIDSVFDYNVNTIKQSITKLDFSTSNEKYWNYIQAYNFMYNKLIKPIESNLTGNKIIIIPDEEISLLPFDAFIFETPTKNTNFDGLKYLIAKYSTSYAYSSTLLFSFKSYKANKIIAFLPNYTENNLIGAQNEVNSIRKGFKMDEFSHGQATESNFKTSLKESAIFHLAMHSSTDTLNSKYSFLIFDTIQNSSDDGKLFNYEISMAKIESPMVVLSACNTGGGDLFRGEGIMSLTRSFLLAGVPSVINTLWDVNDEASSTIMAEFYKNLAKGMEKDDAMRSAKIYYLKNSPPTYSNPYYWAAYQVMGDKSPVKHGTKYVWWLIGLIVIAGTSSFVYNRRKLSKLIS